MSKPTWVSWTEYLQHNSSPPAPLTLEPHDVAGLLQHLRTVEIQLHEHQEYLHNRYKRMPSVVQSCVGHLNQALLDSRASGQDPIVVYDQNKNLFQVLIKE